MKKALMVSALVLFGLAGTAVSSEIGDLPWNDSSIETLRSLDKTAVVRFSNHLAGTNGTPGAMTSDELLEFEWVDLAGDGKYALASTESFGPCCVFLTIYSQDANGKVSVQSFNGAHKLSETVRDLNGNGKKQLIIWTELGAPGSWSPTLSCGGSWRPRPSCRFRRRARAAQRYSRHQGCTPVEMKFTAKAPRRVQ